MLVSRRAFSGVSCTSAGRQQVVHGCKQLQRRLKFAALRATAHEEAQPVGEDR
jgi:hypothetical protein